jgi:glycosyltransferase involved in cell wall biosynthesis
MDSDPGLESGASVESIPDSGGVARPPHLSVVIPSYNMAPNIGRCLESVMTQETSASFEVIVVDSSNDGTEQLVRDRFPNVTLIHLPKRTNAAAARNIGIRRSRAPVVAFLDADCVPEVHWVDAILKAHEGPFDLVSGGLVPATPHTLAGLMLFTIEFSEFLPRSRPRQTAFAPSCNISAKVKALASVGFFPEESQRSHDLIFCWRYARLGRGPILFEPAIRVRHISRAGLRDALQHLALLGRFSAMVRRAHPMRGSFLVAWPALIPLLVPFRYVCILGRLLRSTTGKWLAPVYVVSTPLILLGLAAWTRGFMKGAKT